MKSQGQMTQIKCSEMHLNNCNHSPSPLKNHKIILQLVLLALPVAPPAIQPHYTLSTDAFKVFELTTKPIYM